MGGSHAYPEKLFECAEIACENGADNLSCESVGGKEFADYAVTTGDIVAFLFGVGYLGSIDMTYIWSEFSEIAKKNKAVAGGDTNCSGANVRTSASLEETPTAPEPTFPCSWPEDSSTTMSRRPSPPSPGASPPPGPWLLGRPVPSVPTRTADTRESSAKPSPESPPPRRVRTASAPTATFRVT